MCHDMSAAQGWLRNGMCVKNTTIVHLHDCVNHTTNINIAQATFVPHVGFAAHIHAITNTNYIIFTKILFCQLCSACGIIILGGTQPGPSLATYYSIPPSSGSNKASEPASS